MALLLLDVPEGAPGAIHGLLAAAVACLPGASWALEVDTWDGDNDLLEGHDDQVLVPADDALAVVTTRRSRSGDCGTAWTATPKPPSRPSRT